MAYWWNNTKKLSKEELIEKGKELTRQLTILVVTSCITCVFSMYSLNWLPFFLFSCFVALIVSKYLSSYKQEFYARFCK